ncbi:hypothetical protein [Emcibacter sp. SYSU 3D8]|uniref:MMPL family transporter n=1 Tax=Emcibacter sp. SYSU 3D8 TaxID=3133969 RepID=UPI0031FE59E5
MTRAHAAAAIVASMLVCAALFVVVSFSRGLPIDNDILSLLPAHARDITLSDAVTRAGAAGSSRIVLLVSGGAPENRDTATKDLAQRLAVSGMFRPASDDARQIWNWLHANRTALLCPDDRHKFDQGRGGEVAAAALRQWYMPMSPASSQLLATDPLLLTPTLLSCIAPYNMTLVPTGDGRLIAGSLSQSAYRLDVQDTLSALIDDWKAAWAPKQVRLDRAGAVFHADEGGRNARQEISLITSATAIAVFVLFWSVFGTFRSVGLGLVVILSGVIAGLAATLAVFGTIHVIATVFGAALTGIADDYTIHYLMTGVGGQNASVERRKGEVSRGVLVSLVAAVGAFTALAFFPVVVFQQIALFGAAGLAASGLVALTILPLLDNGKRRKGIGLPLLDRVAAWLLSHRPERRAGAAIALGFTGIVTAAALNWEVLDDIGKFQVPSEILRTEADAVTAATGFTTPVTFMLVSGRSASAVAANEEHLIRELDGAPVRPVTAATWFDPSPARRQANQALIADQLIKPHLASLTASLGIETSAMYDEPEESAPLPDMIAALRGSSGDTAWSIVPVMSDPMLPPNRNWRFVDPAAEYSAVLGAFREQASWGLLGSTLVAGLIVLIAYRRFAALRILIPASMALVLTPALLVLAGVPYSFFSAMALFLVLGVGIDFAVFQWEHPGEAGRWTRVGVLMAAITTIVSTSLLGFSDVYPVHAFGLTVALGIVLNLILSPLAQPRNSVRIKAHG